MRLFIAVSIPALPLVKEAILDLKSLWPRANWVPPENLHITLKFIGEAEGSLVSRIQTVMEGMSLGGRFFVSLAGIGAFPSERAARTLWIGVEEGREALASLAGRLEEALTGLGLRREERTFKPHLTLARFPKGYSPAVGLQPYAGRSFGRFSVDHISLMKSDLSSGRSAIYTVVKAFPA
jgi:RNA 2',3'-cyclic 3'-phosphodiesterase